MTRIFVALAAALTLSACSGDGTNPFTEETEDTDTGGGDTGTPIDSDRVVPPGTESPSASVGIFRSEPTSDDDATIGNGYATDISYDSVNDTFSVDNLAFDGGNVYQRGTAVSSLGPFAVYEADQQYPDSLTGVPINQFTHRAIYGVSTSGNSQFAIVRTGAYVGYGFGGFVYQRDNDVTLPNTGQAAYQGRSAGLRDYGGSGGLDYTTADIQIAIDFNDFNDTTGTRGDAVRGVAYNREVYDINGNQITSTILSRINDDADTNLTAIPEAQFYVGPGVMDDNGEIIGEMFSSYVDSSGQVQTYEEGNYYAIISGDDAEEIVGVFVLESSLDPISTTARDTSGFIVYREP